MKHSYIHTAYRHFVFCLVTTKFLESCPNTKYFQGHSSTFPYSPGVLQYLTTLTNTQHVPAWMATGSMLDDATCMLSRPADGSNVQQITRGCSTKSKPITSFHHVSRSSLPLMWKLLLTCHVLPLWHISTHVNFISSTDNFRAQYATANEHRFEKYGKFPHNSSMKLTAWVICWYKLTEGVTTLLHHLEFTKKLTAWSYFFLKSATLLFSGKYHIFITATGH